MLCASGRFAPSPHVFEMGGGVGVRGARRKTDKLPRSLPSNPHPNRLPSKTRREGEDSTIALEQVFVYLLLARDDSRSYLMILGCVATVLGCDSVAPCLRA